MRRETSDEELARASRLGEMAAFRLLVERHRGRIYSLALRLVRNRAEAEDMAQEAFLRIYQGLASFRGESALATWMVRVALNTFHRHLRHMRRAPARDLDPETAAAEAGPAAPPAAGDPETRAIAAEEAGRVRRLVAELPEPFRDAVTLFYLQDRSVEEAAAVLGVSAGTLKSRLFRAREMLLRRWRDLPAAMRGPRAPGPGTARTPVARREEAAS